MLGVLGYAGFLQDLKDPRSIGIGAAELAAPWTQSASRNSITINPSTANQSANAHSLHNHISLTYAYGGI